MVLYIKYCLYNTDSHSNEHTKNRHLKDFVKNFNDTEGNVWHSDITNKNLLTRPDTSCFRRVDLSDAIPLGLIEPESTS